MVAGGDMGQRAVTLPGNESDDTLWGEYAQALMQENELIVAQSAIATALKINDARPDLWQLSAQCHARQGDNDGALVAWQEAFFRTGNAAAQLDILAEQYAIYRSAQRWAEAQRVTRLALQIAPDDAGWQARARDLATDQSETERRQREAQEAAERQRQEEIERRQREEAAERQRQEEIARRQQEEAARQRREREEHINRLLPASLRAKGFEGRIFNGVEVIVAPTVKVPAGPFLMGSNKRKDAQAYDNELPQQTITLGSFRIGAYPLTVAEYACFVRATNRKAPDEWDNQQQRADHPVMYVSWNDMLAYARWLAQVTGEPWRLPAEAEWEKAARGTDGRIFPWGDQWDKSRANTNDGGPGSTTPVGSYPQGASPYDAFDMAGNVWEWTSTIYKPYHDGRKKDADATSHRVLRGGAWYDIPKDARAACRNRSRFGGNRIGWGGRMVVGARVGS